MALTQEDIWTAAEQLQDRGEQPTLAAVRKELGAGSFTTISEALKAWKAKRKEADQAKIIPPPEALLVSGRAIVNQIWEQAQASAQEQLEAERRLILEAQTRFEREQRELTALADDLSAELETIRAELERTRKEAQANEAEARIRLEEEKRSLGEAREELAKIQGELQAERRHASEAQEKVRHLEAERQSLQEARVRLEGEIEAERRRAEEARERASRMEEERRALEQAKSQLEEEQRKQKAKEDLLISDLDAARAEVKRVEKERQAEREKIEKELEAERQRSAQIGGRLARLEGEIEAEQRHAREAIEHAHREGQRAVAAEAKAADLERQINALGVQETGKVAGSTRTKRGKKETPNPSAGTDDAQER